MSFRHAALRIVPLAASACAIFLGASLPGEASAQVTEMVVRRPAADEDDDEPKKPPSTKEEAVGAVLLQVAALRAQSTEVRGAPLRGDGTSVLFAIDQEISSYLPKSHFAGRSSSHAHIGGGSAGFDAMYQGQLTGGPRFGTPASAIALRAGLGGLIRGNDRYYQSELTLPVGELAYQAHVLHELFFEIGASAGYVLVGRHNVEGYRQRLGSSGKVGGFALVQARRVQLVGSFTRLFASSSPNDPIDTGSVSACVAPLWALLVCGNYSESSARNPSTSDAVEARVHTRFLGISLGLGGLSVD